MSALLEHLKRRIAREGPLTLSDYMAAALTHPRLGYYTTRDPLGARGDFITAPEVSQMFGELIGLCLADAWQRLGTPRPLLLVELGPGRGTLMADALRAMAGVPELIAGAAVHLIEASPHLRTAQERALAPWRERLDLAWHDSLGSLPEGPTLLIANEFFDALPVRQFERSAAGWRERLVGQQGAGLCLTPGPASAVNARLIPQGLQEAADGAVVEVSPAAASLADEIGRRLAARPGAALVIDYGHATHRPGATLQAVRRHAGHDILEAPGEADLTALVDFALLAETAEAAGACSFGPVSQGEFLQALGIELRAETLRHDASPDQARDIAAGVHRLTDPSEMGEHFKVLGLASPGLDSLAGFP